MVSLRRSSALARGGDARAAVAAAMAKVRPKRVFMGVLPILNVV
jgi:hypothetical protein